MLRKGIITAAVLLAVIAVGARGEGFARDLAWDYDQDHEISTGYILYFTDGEEEYIELFPVEETVIVGDTVRITDFESKLGLHPGVEYIFALARHNSHPEPSGQSNTVIYTRAEFVPPARKLPEPFPAPPPARGLRVE